MATIKVKRSGRFPVGTSVGAYARGGRKYGGPPSGTAVESATVDAAGLLEYTGLTASTPYTLYAEVNGEHRYIDVMVEDFTEPGTLAERITKRREEVGA